MPLSCTEQPEHRVFSMLQEFRLNTEPCDRSFRSAALTSHAHIGIQTPVRTLAVDASRGVPDIKPEDLTDRLCRNMIAFVHDVAFLYRLLRHTETPWYARGLLFFPVMYLCSPVQLIPNFIPVVGQMDDFFMIWITKKLVLRLVDQKTRRECHDMATATDFPFLKQLASFRRR